MGKQIEKWIDLSELPRKEGFGINKGKMLIDWKKSMGYKCKFKYDDIEGEVEIVDYTSKGQKLTIKYLDYDLFEIHSGSFTNALFGKLVKKHTNEFKIEIGQTFKDYKRDLIIIDREYIKGKNGIVYKYYKYHCNKCGNKDWIVEYHLLKGIGCNVCCNRIAKLGFNTIWDKARWMVDYFGVSEEDAKKYTSQSSNKIKVKCPYCGKEKKMVISNMYNRKSIGCSCGDGTSYPEKFIMSLLYQLNVDYINQYNPEWIKPKRYDFYFELNNKKIIIETHGDFHYSKKGYTSKRAKTLKEEQENDKYKKELALNNSIDYYIELDCRASNLEFIKNSILNSELNKIFDLSQINWLKCEEFALNNRVKEICNYWRIHNEINNEELTTSDLSKIFKLDRHTIRIYLKNGSKLSWCNYNPKDERIKTGFKAGKMSGKQVEIFDKNGKSLGIFGSCHELERQSEELFGVKFNNINISLVANCKRKQHKGFTFKYIENKE